MNNRIYILATISGIFLMLLGVIPKSSASTQPDNKGETRIEYKHNFVKTLGR